MGMGGSKKAKEPPKGADGLPLPSVTSATPTAGNPIPRQSVAVQEKLTDTKSATLLQSEEDELLKKGMG